MLVPFDILPDSSRVWVYTAEKPLLPEQKKIVTHKLETFLENWQSHQLDVKASYALMENRFLVIAVDESYNGISGCGIDKSFHLIQEIEVLIGQSLTSKTHVLFEKDGNVLSLPFNKIKESVASGALDSDDYFFNTLVANLDEFRRNFKIKAKEGWVKKYFVATYSN